MGFHLPRIAIILYLLVLLEYAAADSLALPPSSFHPAPDYWENNSGPWMSIVSGSATYVDYVFNQQGEGWVTLSVYAYGYTGSPTSPTPAQYVIEVNGQDVMYPGNQPQPVVFSLNPAFQYRVVLGAPDGDTGTIINSVVVSRPDPPVSPTSTHSITNNLPPSSAAVASTAQSSSLSASSPSSNPSSSPFFSSPRGASTGTSTGTVNATSIAGQSLGVPIFVTISGSVVPSQTNAFASASSSGSTSPSIGVILGPIAGVIVIMIIATFIFIRRRKQARGKREEDEIDSYLVESEAQQHSPSSDPSMKEQRPIILERSQALFYGTGERGEGTASREMAVAPAPAHVSPINGITENSLSSHAQGGVERPSSNPSAPNSRTSISGVDDETVAPPPAYVEEERTITPRNDQS